MLQPATISFLTKLNKNNNKNWFDDHRKEYEAAKQDFEQMVTQLHGELSKFEPGMAEQRAKDSIFRIFRDVRFAKDKTPYKDHFGAYFSRAGRKAPDAGYYIHIQPGKAFVAGGLWMPEAPLLKATRQEIDYNLDELQSILKQPTFKKHFKKLEGEQLKTLPQGYTADNPAIDYLKMKSFIVSTPIDDKDITSRTFVPKVVKLFSVMKPLVDFLNRGLD
ncbi:DUF2461 domain-containing protein [Polluticoccus soli]|uniref:DUF2461 domain-containing protein n=1 Tax=Polluticoccus soli TaxID=3034150 RepID=UPI0023E275BA|nr:DUF2461 domain-containing protein [Flavipsychrobacter sp. JY13-12]